MAGHRLAKKANVPKDNEPAQASSSVQHTTDVRPPNGPLNSHPVDETTRLLIKAVTRRESRRNRHITLTEVPRPDTPGRHDETPQGPSYLIWNDPEARMLRAGETGGASRLLLLAHGGSAERQASPRMTQDERGGKEAPSGRTDGQPVSPASLRRRPSQPERSVSSLRAKYRAGEAQNHIQPPVPLRAPLPVSRAPPPSVNNFQSPRAKVGHTVGDEAKVDVEEDVAVTVTAYSSAVMFDAARDGPSLYAPKDLLNRYPHRPVSAAHMLPVFLRFVADAVEDAVRQPGPAGQGAAMLELERLQRSGIFRVDRSGSRSGSSSSSSSSSTATTAMPSSPCSGSRSKRTVSKHTDAKAPEKASGQGSETGQPTQRRPSLRHRTSQRLRRTASNLGRRLSSSCASSVSSSDGDEPTATGREQPQDIEASRVRGLLAQAIPGYRRRGPPPTSGWW